MTLRMNRVINKYDGELTFKGRIMARLPVSTQLTRLMLLGHAFGMLQETIIIAACLCNKSFFSTPYRSSFLAFKLVSCSTAMVRCPSKRHVILIIKSMRLCFVTLCIDIHAFFCLISRYILMFFGRKYFQEEAVVGTFQSK